MKRIGVGVALAVLCTSGLSAATPNFPSALERRLGLGFEPPCSICHQNGITGRGTVVTPFGSAMRARGLVAYDENALQAALDRMQEDGVDSDGDGIPDLDELRMGRDPNEGDGASLGEGPAYGCGARIARGNAQGSAIGVIAVMLGWVLWRRRVQGHHVRS